MTSVRLTASEIGQGAQAGAIRRMKSFQFAERAGHKEGDGWDIDVEGACAELAVCKSLGVYWSAHIGAYEEPDVVYRGAGLHVRWTAPSDNRLIIRPRDLEKVEKLREQFPQQRFVLVTGICPTYRIHGSYDAFAALRLTDASSYWLAPNGRPGAWFVPQVELEQMPTTGSTFPATIP